MNTLVYDSDCGPCTRFRNVIDFLDAKRRLRYIGLIDADRQGMLRSVSPSRRHRSFHLVSCDGRVWSGAEALPPLVALLPGGRPLSAALALCPPAYSAATFTYAAFSRLHDAGTCGYSSHGTPVGHE